MGMFVSGRIAITAKGVTDEKDITPLIDVVFIRTKMDYGTRQRVIGAAAKLVAKAGGNRKERRAAKKGKGASDVEFDVGAYQVALLVHNILGWQGPSFAGVACVPANIETLDTDEPLVKEVVQAISDRNVQESDTDEETDEDGDDPNVIDLKPIAKSLTSSTDSG